MPIEIETINLEYRRKTTRSSGATDNVQAPRNRDYACRFTEREREARTGDKLKPVDVGYPIKFSAPVISASPG